MLKSSQCVLNFPQNFFFFNRSKYQYARNNVNITYASKWAYLQIKKIEQLSPSSNISRYKLKYSINTQKFTESLIQSLQQNIQGSSMLKKGQYTLAIRQFEIALKFLPKQLNNDENHYKAEYEGLLKKLLQAHVMANKSIKLFLQNYKQYLTQNSPLTEFIKTIQQIEDSNFVPLQTLQQPQKLWQQLVKAFSFRQSKQCFGKHVPIQKVQTTKDLALKYIGLYLYEKIKARKNKEREDIYLNACRQLLKYTQKFQPSKIVKPLSLMACNLLAGEQYLQAEGLLSHCLSFLDQFYHQNHLYIKTDQEYILCKLLIARVFEGVRRDEETKKIREEYEPIFDQKKFFLQQLVQISYQEL